MHAIWNSVVRVIVSRASVGATGLVLLGALPRVVVPALLSLTMGVKIRLARLVRWSAAES